MTETITIENPKNIKLTLECGMSGKTFIYQWVVKNLWKSLAKSYSVAKFLKSIAETITIENLELTLKKGICQ